jgi:hypothetical protein
MTSDEYKGRDLPIRVLSLGAGVQSTVVLLMSLHGELPPLDLAVFADTQWEPRAVYGHLEWLEGVAFEHGLPVHTVTAGNLRESLVRGANLTGGRFITVPMYTNTNGKQGIMRRQCTREYKIAPIELFTRREILGLRYRQHAPKYPVVERWMGISVDEVHRAKTSRTKWEDNYYPLLEKGMTREDCRQWFVDHYGDRELPRSACIGCPYKSNAEWRALPPDEFADAVAVDEAVRTREGMHGEAFLHRSCKPLRDVDLRTMDDAGQLNWINECEGMCGV